LNDLWDSTETTRTAEPRELPEGMVIFALYLLKTSAVPEGKRKYKGVKEI
jgi:hypothetical protein